MPAFLTALEIALMAVHSEFKSVVNSPVPFAFLPSSKTNLVKVTTLVSKAPLSDILEISAEVMYPQNQHKREDNLVIEL